MSYQQEISREHKALFVFLLDQSFSMEEPIANSNNRKMDELATALNALLENLVMTCTGESGIKDRMDVSVIGYRTDLDANAIIESPLKDSLKDRDYVSIEEIERDSDIETRTEEYYDEEVGETKSQESEFPVWVRPVAEGGTPMCSALHRAYQIVDSWIEAENHRESFPPIVIHITDGENSEDEADPLQYADPLKELETNDGNVLLFNCHLSMTKADKILFPSNAELLPDEHTRLLFNMSSVLPEPMYNNAIAEGYDLKKGARGMVFNAGGVELIKFLEIGTKVAHQLR